MLNVQCACENFWATSWTASAPWTTLSPKGNNWIFYTLKERGKRTKMINSWLQCVGVVFNCAVISPNWPSCSQPFICGMAGLVWFSQQPWRGSMCSFLHCLSWCLMIFFWIKIIFLEILTFSLELIIIRLRLFTNSSRLLWKKNFSWILVFRFFIEFFFLQICMGFSRISLEL